MNLLISLALYIIYGVLFSFPVWIIFACDSPLIQSLIPQKESSMKHDLNKIDFSWFNKGRLCDWEFLTDHFLVIDLKHWTIGVSVYINENSIEISCLCFEITIQ